MLSQEEGNPSQQDFQLSIYPPDDKVDPHMNPHQAAVVAALTEVTACRAKLTALGERPDHDTIEFARRAIADVDAELSQQLESIVMAPRPEGTELGEWRAFQSEREQEARCAAEDKKLPHEAVIQIEEFHVSLELLLKKAEENLVKLSYPPNLESLNDQAQLLPVEEGVNDEVVKILQQAQEHEIRKVDLNGRGLIHLPEAFGKIATLVTLELANNQLKVLPDSIGGLQNLQILDVENNLLEALPDSIGLLKNLKILNVCTNKLVSLPDSLLQCSALVVLKAGFNVLLYLPTNIGIDLVNLEQISVPLNKLRLLPASICHLKSLKYLDANFNQLKSLPTALGNLVNLEVLDVSSNFHDLETVPDSIGDLISLTDLNLSYNQIHVLPDSFGRLRNLKKLKLEQNPLIIPPLYVVECGLEAVMAYMRKRWEDQLLEEQQSLEESTGQTAWLPWGLGRSWLTRVFSGVSGSNSGNQGRSSWKESSAKDYLEQQL